MSEFEFESTPEDAWDSSDPISELIHNLLVRTALLDNGPREESGTIPELLTELKQRVRATLMVRTLSDFDRHRGDLILQDADFVAVRFQNET